MEVVNLNEYSRVLVAFSGGKDSMACVLHLLESGVPKEKIELHHHLIDGREGNSWMDWPVTEPYCRAFAEAFGLPIYFSWKEGGFMREATRTNAKTAPIWWESPEGLNYGKASGNEGTRNKFPQVSPNLNVRWCSAYHKMDIMKRTINNDTRFRLSPELAEKRLMKGEARGKTNTRNKFPQVSPNMMTRWCSGYLKLHPMSRLLNNDKRLRGGKILVVSGERAQESTARAGYCSFQPHESDNRSDKLAWRKRHIDRSRIILHWTEQQVWEIIERWRIRVHPVYYAGTNRCSCRFCIFASSNQMRTAAETAPEDFEKLANLEESFGVTMKRKDDLRTFISKGKVNPALTPELKAILNSTSYDLPIIMSPDEQWILPAGAYKESTGPS